MAISRPRQYIRLSLMTATQNTRHIRHLGSATGKKFNTHFLSSPTTILKRQPFPQIGLQEREDSDLDYASPATQNGSSKYILC
jgi:hypothetical protein